MSKLIYAGVGARATPPDIIESMKSIGYQMSQSGWYLRSGYADGADKAFGFGAAQHAELSGIDQWEMHLPWQGYNGAPKLDPRFLVPFPKADIVAMARECHPIWDELNQPVRMMMIRNVTIVAGLNLDEPANCLIGWTPEAKRKGGTGHAMRVAEMLGVPVFDLASAYDRKNLCEHIVSCEERYRTVDL